MGIGANIKFLLRENNKTVKWLSAKSGISINTLYNITRKDNCRVHPDRLELISNCFNIPVKELISDSLIPDKLQSVSTDFDISKSAQEFRRINEITTDVIVKFAVNREFELSLKNKEKEIHAWINGPSLTLPKEAILSIVERKKLELKLIRNFFKLTPQNQEFILQSINILLSNQNSLSPDQSGHFKSYPSPQENDNLKLDNSPEESITENNLFKTIDDKET